MSLVRVVVVDDGRYWIDQVRARLGDLAVRVRHVTSLAECLGSAGRERGAVVLAALDGSVRSVVEFVEVLCERDPAAAVVVIGGAALSEFEPAVREAGAVHFFRQPPNPRDVAEVIRRLVAARYDDRNRRGKRQSDGSLASGLGGKGCAVSESEVPSLPGRGSPHPD